MKIIVIPIVFLMLFTCSFLGAQVFPNDGDALHYRLIGFTFPEREKATQYTLEIYEYHTIKDGSNETVKLLEKTDSTNRIIATVPSFGKKYMWRVKCLRKNRVIHTTRDYYFSIKPNPFSDTSATRVIILDSASRYQDMLVFFDNTRSLYNMNGEAVWYLPEIKGVTDMNMNSVRDMKLTGDGTITFLTNTNIFEITYSGQVLWSGPNDGKVSGDTSEYYHHEFTKLVNGHYLAASSKLIMRKVPDQVSSSSYRGRDTEMRNGRRYTKISCGTLIEYDSAGNILWTWNSCDHLTDEDLFTPLENGIVRPYTHLNGFYLDLERQVFYASFRDINRIIKAKYPSGEVLAQYGENFTGGAQVKGHGMFYAQHSCRINADGNLYFFNNNHLTRATPRNNSQDRISTVLVLKEPMYPADTPLKIWEFKCDIDTYAKAFSPGGGGVYELTHGDYLVCMGASNRNFIVSNDKRMLWNVIIQFRNDDGAWNPLSGYRISAVEAKDIRKLLFPEK